MRRSEWILTLCLVVSLAARAQDAADPFARGIDVVPNKATPLLNSGITLDGAEQLHRGSWGVQALLDLNWGLLSLKSGDAYLGQLIPFRMNLNLMAGFQLHNRIDVGAELPITLYQATHFGLMAAQGFPQEEPRAAGLGALRLFGRFQILRQSEVPIVGLAAILEMRAPTGDTFSFTSDRGFVFAPRVAVERAFGPVRVLANVGWRLRTAPGRYLNIYVGQEFTLGGGAIVALPDWKRLTHTELIGELAAATPAEAPFTFAQAEALKSPLELLIGGRTMLAERWGVSLSFGKGLGPAGYGREAFRVILGAKYQVTTEPDQDGDGIPDRLDQCIDVPEDKDGFEDKDGCPEPGPDLDGDGDTVPDSVDGCPDQPGLPQLDGCPDRDNDQIPDNVDKCPDDPGPPELQGCPPPEEEEEVVLESERIRINNQILFEFGSDVIDPRSYKLLDEVAAVLQKNKDVGPVIIEGHTDNVGSRAYNIDLSKRRAKAVENYLVGKGVEARRLRSDGFGFDRPIAPNDTPLNRAKNRRTEFKLLDEKNEQEKQQDAPKPEAPKADAPKPAAPAAPKPAPK
ncbi:MAG: OmpA family protein [Myxococcota bacterium]